MAGKDLKDLLLHTLRDVYFAEHEILKALPEMAAKARRAELRQAFETHRAQTEGQVGRLERVFGLLGEEARGVPCEAIRGILAEGREVAAAQAVEHYEIARYGALRSWAELAGLDEAEGLLEATLDEERATDALLTELAEAKVNVESA